MQLRLNSAAADGEPRHETESGVDYLAVPATIGREGIYEYHDQDDAYDREFVAGEEWADAADGFEGVPAVADHPVAATEGTVTPATTQTPGAQTTEVGDFRDSRMNADDTNLHGELWLREDERDAHGPAYEEAFDALEAGDAWEVSPGYGVERINAASGTHDGESFDARQEGLDPDHVAIVLHGNARCDISQGCAAGVSRYNAEQSLGGVAAGTPLAPSDPNDMTDPSTDDDPDAPLRTNARLEARTPEFEDTLSEAALENRRENNPHEAHTFWGVSEYLDAYQDATGESIEGDPYSVVSSIPDAARTWIAEHTLLGNADAASEENLMLFNVVSPDGDLHETKLDDVIGQDGAEATLPQETRESAREVARTLLEEEFGREFGDDDGGRQNASDPTFRERFRDEFLRLFAPDDGRLNSIDLPDDAADTAGADSGSTTTEPSTADGGDDADASETTTETDMTDPDTLTDDEMIDYLAEETEIDRENAEMWRDEDCLGVTYERFNAEVETDTGEGGGGGDTDTESTETTDSPDEPGGEDTDGETADEEPAVTFDTREEFESEVEDVIESRENARETESLIEWIDSRSERYNAETLDGTPKGVLEEIADDVADDRANANTGGSAETPPQADRGPMQTGGPIRANADTDGGDLPPSSDDETYAAATGGDD